MRNAIIVWALIVTTLFYFGSGTPNRRRNHLPTRSQILEKFFEVSHHPKTKGTTCFACTVIVDGLQALLQQNKTDEELENFAIKACETLGIEEDYVCDHIVHLMADEVLFVLERVIVTPEEVCGAFVEDCGSAVNPLNYLWNITIPGNKPTVKTWPEPEAGKPTMRVLHLTDIHVDRNYVVGSEANCEKGHPFFEFCCYEMPGDGVKVNVPAGKWGMPYKCDIPFPTFENTLKQIAEREKDKLDFIYITGDMEPHSVWDYSKEFTMANLDNVSATIRSYFPGIPIYEAIGNHEGVPIDAIAYHGMEEYDTRNPQWLYDTLANNWQTWLTDSAIETVKYRASYAIKPFTGFKLISLNSIYCSFMDLYNYLNQVDPDGTLNWLIKELMASEQLKEKVHIISHIPPGVSYCLKGWSHNFYRIVNRFENTIVGQFYGHTHLDHFEVFYDNFDSSGRATGVNYIAPSLTTYSYNNPAYRIYTIDGNYEGSTYTVLDTETYATDLLKANQENHEPEWYLTYSAKADYGMADLSPASWNMLISRMEEDNNLFSKYLWNLKRTDHETSVCGSACKQRKLCDARSAMSYDDKLFCPDLGEV